MSFTTCPICEERYYEYTSSLLSHRCDPAWEVWEDSECREKTVIVHSMSAEDAATKACEQWDDYGDGPSEREVWVCPKGSEDPEAVESFSVCPEPQVVYYANASYETYNPED